MAAAAPVKSLGILFPEVAGAATALTQANFAACVNTTFRVTVASKAVDLVLLSVTPGIKPSSTGDCFSLLFSGSKIFDSGTYSVTQATLGTFALFVGPVSPAAKKMYYEAVFTTW